MTLEAALDNLQQGAQRILDIGGGSGYVSALFHEAATPGATVHYVDNNRAIVKFARDNLETERPQALDGTLTKQIVLHCTGNSVRPGHALTNHPLSV